MSINNKKRVCTLATVSVSRRKDPTKKGLRNRIRMRSNLFLVTLDAQIKHQVSNTTYACAGDVTGSAPSQTGDAASVTAPFSAL